MTILQGCFFQLAMLAGFLELCTMKDAAGSKFVSKLLSKFIDFG